MDPPGPLKFYRHWIIRIAVIVKAFATLAAIPTGHYQTLEQRRRGETLLLKLVIHNVRDVVSGIEPHKIQQGERAHGITAAQLHGIVNVRNRAHTLLES